MINIVRNATRVLRALFIFRLFAVAFGILVFAISWSASPPLETPELPSGFGLVLVPMMVASLITMLFLFLPGLEKRMGRLYLPIALAMTIVAFNLESGVAYLHPGRHVLIVLPSGRAISLFQMSSEMVLLVLVPCVLAGTAYGLRGALRASNFATLFHLATFLALWLSGTSPRGFLALLPLRLAVLYGFSLIAGYLADTWRREHEALQEANRQLRGYAATVEHLATSRERVRLARDMHDTLAHSLSAVVVQLEAVDTLHETNPDAAREQLSKVRQQARVGLDEARRAILNLRSAPIEEVGLAAAIEHLIEQFGQRNGIQIDWAVEGEPVPLLPVQANALYRIAEEAMSNVERHAEAGQLAVRLSYADGVTLSVQDDGQGFDPATTEPDRYGLVGIRERAALVDAQVTVDSAPNEGTTLTVKIAEPWKD